MRLCTLTLFGLSAAILASCGGPSAVEYRLTFDTQEPAAVEELSKATIRVMQRRLDRIGGELMGQDIAKDSDGLTLTMNVSDSKSAKALTEEMTAPFDLQIMTQTDTATGSDVTVEGLGAFTRTGVAGEDLGMVRSGTNVDKKTGYVLIQFTDAGLAKMRDVFAKNVGKQLGLFVRGKLVSSLEVKGTDLQNPLVIDGVPNPEVAAIFADDVNVGNHVVVSPL